MIGCTEIYVMKIYNRTENQILTGTKTSYLYQEIPRSAHIIQHLVMESYLYK